MNTIIEEYLNFIQIEKGLSSNTIGAYRRDLKNEEYLEERKFPILISWIVKDSGVPRSFNRFGSILKITRTFYIYN